jgi:RNA polymerase sigma-70 factor (ECF subfamily)
MFANEEEETSMLSGSEMPAVRSESCGGPPPVRPQKTQRRSRNVSKIARRSPDTADQTELIERLKSGDQSALETVFDLYSVKLYNVALRILGEPADTEEVIQDVFWTVYRKAKSFQGNSQFSTWLYRLTVNAALGKIRRRKSNKAVDYEEYLPKFEADGHHRVRPVVDWSDNLDEQYSKVELQGLLGKALDQLKPLDKSVVVLSDLEGLSDREIADSLGISVSAVKTRLHRARLFLRGKMAVHLGCSPA